jgi:hypothetical protein
MVPGSITYVPENAQGQEFLKNVFQAAYEYDSAKFSFFFMSAIPAQTGAAWKSYLEFSGKLGGKATQLPDVAGAKIFQAENFGKCKIIYQREGELGGVIDAGDAGKARQFVEDYLQGKTQ